MPIVKRTYASNRTLRPDYPSSPRSSYSSDPIDPHDAPLGPARFLVDPESELTPGVLGKRKRTTNVSVVLPARGGENGSINLLKFLVPSRPASGGQPPPVKKRVTTASTLSPINVPITSSDHSIATTTTKIRKKSKTSQQSRSDAGRQLTQLHLTLGKTTLRTCPLCSLSYTRGAPDDEDLHKKHCARISRGAEWGKEEARSEGREVTVVEEGVVIRGRDGKEERGRIVKFNANAGGKLGTKVNLNFDKELEYSWLILIHVHYRQLAIVLQTVNHALSAPDLTPEILADSKAYLFLLSSTSATSTAREREKIVGCVIAQRIETAMKIVPSPSQDTASNDTPLSPSKLFNKARSTAAAREDLIVKSNTTNNSNSSDSTLPVVTVRFSDDSDDTGLFCSSTPLPTPLGIPRLFVSSSHRHKGIASSLLDAVTRTFIHGCPLRAELGHIAFSQPTRAGRGVMEKWGKGGVRIYQE